MAKPAPPMAKIRRVDFSPDEWLAGTRELTLEERGAYWDVCSMMYSRGGPIPEGKCVCHTCDVPGCINLDHLWLGTVAENNADCIQKNRARSLKGEDHPHAKLSDSIVREIRVTSTPTKVLARRYAVDRATVRAIRRGALWSHI